MPSILSPGDVIDGRYRILGFLDAGGQALAYHATDLHALASQPWRQEVFVKQYHDLFVDEGGLIGVEQVREYYEHLKERLGGARQYFAMPISVCEDDGIVFVAFEFVRGQTLDQLIARGFDEESGCDLDAALRARLACGLANAVRHVHKGGVIHLDIKPSNVMVRWSAKHAQHFVSLIDVDASRIDGVGLRDAVIGTPGYHSPEHREPSVYGALGAPADIFGLGIVLWELLFDSTPFPCSGPDDYLAAITAGSAVVPSSEYDREVIAVMLRMLRPRAERRPSAGKVYFSLNKYRDIDLRASSLDRRWVPLAATRLHLWIADGDGSRLWERSYYSSVVVGATQLRGSGVREVPSALLEFRPSAASTWRVKLLTPFDVRLDGKSLLVGLDAVVREGMKLQLSGVAISSAVQQFPRGV